MKQFKIFVIKEFLHIFRDVRSMIVLFGMPIVQIILFGYAISNDVKNAEIAVLDLSKDNFTLKITDKLISSGYFSLTYNLASLDEVETYFKKGKIKEVIIFEKDFARRLKKDGIANVQIISDATEPNTSSILVNYTSGIITAYQNELYKETGIPYRIVSEVRMQFNPELKSSFMFIPGTMVVILMLICAMMTSISIAREKENGTMEVLLVSPLKPLQIIIGKVVPYVFISFIIAIIILTLGAFVFGLVVKGSLIFLLAEITLFIIMALSLGILISTLARTQQIAMIISLMGLMLPSIILSGFIVPVENMPIALQWFSNIIPAKWFIIIIRSIILKGSGIALLWKETLILILMILVFVSISVKKFKIRLE